MRVWIRARDVSVATEAPRGLSLRNVIKGTLVEIGPGDGDTRRRLAELRAAHRRRFA